MAATSKNPILERIYNLDGGPEETRDAYKDWAKSYDEDTVEGMGYVAPAVAADKVKSLVKPDAVILDAGCGTGLVGEELVKLGYSTMDALDYSQEMLDEAEQKNIYKRHMQVDLSKPLDIEDNFYGAIVCTGTFTYGHVKAHAFDELVRITKPGGIICFTIREGAYEDYVYRQRMIELEQENSWELLGMEDTDYLTNEGITCKMCTYRVAA